MIQTQVKKMYGIVHDTEMIPIGNKMENSSGTQLNHISL